MAADRRSNVGSGCGSLILGTIVLVFVAGQVMRADPGGQSEPILSVVVLLWMGLLALGFIRLIVRAVRAGQQARREAESEPSAAPTQAPSPAEGAKRVPSSAAEVPHTYERPARRREPVSEPVKRIPRGIDPRAGWYPDPDDPFGDILRWWDGKAWTEHTRE